MKRALKTYFIPHAENNYHPRILHTKRAIFYGAFFVVLKLVLILFVLALPARVFVLPDVLAGEQKKILTITNELRAEKGLKPLREVAKLDSSAQNKADDMAKYGYFSHISPEQKTVSDWMRENGYSYFVAGENLAMGFSLASDVVDAWIKSPTHYGNLIDSEFLEFGAGLQSGEYAGVATVFVAEHFAAPALPAGRPAAVKSPAKVVPPVARVKTKKALVVKTAASPKKVPAKPSPAVVLAEKEEAIPVALAPDTAVYNESNSRVYWQEENGQTTLSARAEISGALLSATVAVGDYQIELQRSGDTLFSGKLTIDEPADNFFKVIVAPTIVIIAKDGQIIKQPIEWYNVKVVSPSPAQTYFNAKDALTPITNIFTVSRWVYLAAIVFFALALALNIFIEIKKQHPHIILQTVGLLGLLTGLFLM